MSRRLTASAIALALTVTLAACGSEDSSADTTPATGAPGGSTPSAALNTADVEFAQGMIAHHEQAIEMAEIALDHNVGASTEVIDLATRIKGAQDPEVELMTGWLTATGEPVAMDMSDGHDMSSMDGMMTAEQMDGMAAMTGPEFDQMWLEMMIDHHEGAISQSETVKAGGSNADVLTLADQIITAQQGEIAEIEGPAPGLNTSPPTDPFRCRAIEDVRDHGCPLRWRKVGSAGAFQERYRSLRVRSRSAVEVAQHATRVRHVWRTRAVHAEEPCAHGRSIRAARSRRHADELTRATHDLDAAGFEVQFAVENVNPLIVEVFVRPFLAT